MFYYKVGKYRNYISAYRTCLLFYIYILKQTKHKNKSDKMNQNYNLLQIN